MALHTLGDAEELKREQASDEFTANIVRTLKEGKQFSCELERWHKYMEFYVANHEIAALNPRHRLWYLNV